MQINTCLRPSVGASAKRSGARINTPCPIADLSALCPTAYPGYKLRQGSNARDSSSPPARSSPVILSAAKDLAAARDRPFAEFPLSEAHGLGVTRGDCSTCYGLFFTSEPCLTR